MIQYIEIRNTDRELIGIIENAMSIIWQVEYVGTGNFEITVPYTDERLVWLQPDNYITRPDRNEIGFIENVSLDYNVTEGRTITASGKFGCVLLERRLWYNRSGNKCRLRTISEGTTIENACRSVVGNTLVDALDYRKVTWLSLGTNHSYSETTKRRETTYGNVLELLAEVLTEGVVTVIGGTQPSPLGHRINFNASDLTANYEIYKGEKRNITFSQKYKNLITFNYTYDRGLYKNYFLIGGDGEGADRFYTARTRNSTVPEQRREYFYDSSLGKTYNNDSNQKVNWIDEMYELHLQEDCEAVFPETSSQKKISGTVDLTAYTYGTDYNVGDVVTITDDDTAINTSARIWAITEIQNDNGYSVEADFEGESV